MTINAEIDKKLHFYTEGEMNLKQAVTGSIKNRLIIYILAITIVSVMISVGPALYFFTDYADEAAQDKAIRGAEGLRAILEGQKQEALNYATIFASNAALTKAVEEKNTAEVLRYLTPLVNEAKIDFVTVTDEKGKVIARTHEPDKKGDSVTNQANVSMALQGTPLAAIEPGTAVKLSARAGVPVKNNNGQIVGVISAGYSVATNAIVDKAQGMFNTDMALFLGDTRVATTMVKDGQRDVGTKLNEKISTHVLQQGQFDIDKGTIMGQDYVTVYMPLMGPNDKPVGIVVAGQNMEAVNAAKNKIMVTVGAIAAAVILVVMVLTAWMVRKTINPLKKLAEVVDIVANGDLTQNVNVMSDNEIGLLAAGFNKMIGQLKSLVMQVNTLVSTVAESAATLKMSSEQSAQASEQVAVSITEVADGMETQVKAINETSAIIEQMSASVEQIAANANSSSAAADGMGDGAKAGKKTITTAVEQMQLVEETVINSALAVEKLGDRSSQIGQIVAVIGGLASQTNLLALNAAIEAARAGEHGRGFAVVAEEVRKLAEQSRQSAEQISNLIVEIQADTQKAVQAMNEGTREVKLGAEVVNSAGESFAKIEKLIEDVSLQVRQISAATQEMAQGSQHMVSSVHDIETVGKRTSEQTQIVAAATEEQSASVQEMASASHNLLTLAQQLQDIVNKFKV